MTGDGRVGPCIVCGAEMGTKRVYRQLGLVRHDSHQRCTACAKNLRMGARRRPAVLPLMPPRPEWMENAPCSTVDPDLFFADGKLHPDLVRQAKSICEACPYKAPCLTWALTYNEPYGIWSGLTPRERETLSREDLLGAA